MRIEPKQKIKPVTRIEALAALWRIKLQLGQHPIHMLWMEPEQLPRPQVGLEYTPM